MTQPKEALEPHERMRGCLLGGAVGDALGAAVEFMPISDIRRRFGEGGLRELTPCYGRLGAITDDTQMTLFTAEGVLRAHQRLTGRGICAPDAVIHHALLRWLHTQGEKSECSFYDDGWLIQERELFSARAPGNTCLSALRASKQFGDKAVNDSKGCGGVMRVAPIGLYFEARVHSEGQKPPAFVVACDSAESTHGHPSSTFASGYFALVIAHLKAGASLLEAFEYSREPLRGEVKAEEVTAALDAAMRLAQSAAPSTPETVAELGEGWVAEEALAIAVFCALRAESFPHALRLSVNHSGDSDSTGSLTGQLLGTLWGARVIPEHWLDVLELRPAIERLASDLASAKPGVELDGEAYPGM